MAYYSPQMTQLPTLNRQRSTRDWSGMTNLYSRSAERTPTPPPPQPPPVRQNPPPVPTQKPPPQTVPTTTPPPISPVTQSLVASSPYGYSGGVYQPTPAQGTTARWAYRPITFPGIREQGSGWAKYEDGGVVYYNSPQWSKASAYRPPEGLGDLWQAIPDSWKVNLGNIPTQFTDAILQAIALGNNAQAADIYRNADEYMRAVSEGQPPPPLPQVEMLQPPYYVPGVMR